MDRHKYILEPYKGMNTRYRCPTCQQKDRTFSLYIDTETMEHIHPSVGRCNRENSCGYHYTPNQYFQDNNLSLITPQYKPYKFNPNSTQTKPISYIPVEVFKASLNPNVFQTNHFVKFIIGLFGIEVVNELISSYFIATSKHWSGATVFWQIDTKGKIRTGKIMLYSPVTGKRVKEPHNHIHWAHKALKQPEFELKQCLFGEHLLIDKTKPVAIVESEKTAVIASIYLPQFIWLAVGGLSNLTVENCRILQGRNVTLFPDLQGFDKWNSKAKELSHLANFTVSDLLERKASIAEKKQGFDLADYLIKFDFKAFALPAPEVTTHPVFQPSVQLTPINQAYNFLKPEQQKHGNWEKDISELQNYSTGKTLLTQPVKLNQYNKVINIPSDYPNETDLAEVLIEALKNEVVVYSEAEQDEIRSKIEYSPQSIELHRKRLEMKSETYDNTISKEESNRALQYFADNDVSTYRL